MRFLSRAFLEMTVEVIPNPSTCAQDRLNEVSHLAYQLFMYFLVLLLAVMRFLSRAFFEMTVEVIPNELWRGGITS